MEKMDRDKRLLELTRLTIDLKKEKKDYLVGLNEQIKNAEAEIKSLCVEEVT